MKRNPLSLLSLLVLALASCALAVPEIPILELVSPVLPEEPAVKKWTFIIYMAADNDLESAAIMDFNELEAAGIDGTKMNVLVFIDRCPGHDSTNGNWTDTRLYEIVPDTAGSNTVIVSDRIACPPLGITATGSVELDLSDPAVLAYLTRFAKDTYPAERYALIFWGHGTGWRSGSRQDGSSYMPSRAVAIDDTSSGYMGITDANKAIADCGISILGFDTCFGAMLEIAYEFVNSAEWIAASEGITPSTGWDYSGLFSRFMASDISPSAFGTAVIGQYTAQYGGTPGTAISFIDLSSASRLRTAFETFSREIADSIESESEASALRSMLLDGAHLVHAQAWPCDAFIDIACFADRAAKDAESITANPERRTVIKDSAATLQQAVSDTVVSSWQENPDAERKIGVFLVPMTAPDVPLTPHSPDYTRGSGSAGQSSFVRSSNGWVPTTGNEGSLLDKLFYTVF